MDNETYFAVKKLVQLKCREVGRQDLWLVKQTQNIKTYWSDVEDPSAEGCFEYLLELFPEKISSRKKI